MTTDTLHDYGRLVDAGCSDEQARSSTKTDGGDKQELEAMGGPRNLPGNRIAAPYTKLTA